MADNKKQDEKAADERPDEKPAERLTAEEYLALAAEALERRRAPHAPKHYRLLAEEVRKLAARIE